MVWWCCTFAHLRGAIGQDTQSNHKLISPNCYFHFKTNSRSPMHCWRGCNNNATLRLEALNILSCFTLIRLAFLWKQLQKCVFPLNPQMPKLWQVFSTIARQQVELVSCSALVKIWKVLYFRLKKFGSFGFRLFCGWRHNWGRLKVFDPLHRDLRLKPKRQFLFLLKETRLKSASCRVLVCPRNVCGCHVVANKTWFVKI